MYIWLSLVLWTRGSMDIMEGESGKQGCRGVAKKGERKAEIPLSSGPMPQSRDIPHMVIYILKVPPHP